MQTAMRAGHVVRATLEAKIAGGPATVEGDAGILKVIVSTTVDFDLRVDVMHGTKAVGIAQEFASVPARYGWSAA
jgi:hypothetical protein